MTEEYKSQRKHSIEQYPLCIIAENKDPILGVPVYLHKMNQRASTDSGNKRRGKGIDRVVWGSKFVNHVDEILRISRLSRFEKSFVDINLGHKLL